MPATFPANALLTFVTLTVFSCSAETYCTVDDTLLAARLVLNAPVTTTSFKLLSPCCGSLKASEVEPLFCNDAAACFASVSLNSLVSTLGGASRLINFSSLFHHLTLRL